MSIRLLFVFGAGAWGACVSGRLADVTGASISNAKVLLESRSAVVAETLASEDGHFRVCANEPGEYRVVAALQGFRRRATPPSELRQDVDLGAVEMQVNLEEAIIFRVLPNGVSDPYLDASGSSVRFTGRDGVRRKFTRQPNDRQHNLDSEWKRVVFLRGNEIWVDKRRVYTHAAFMWEPEFMPDGKSIRFWSTTWRDGDRQFTVPINETGSRR